MMRFGLAFAVASLEIAQPSALSYAVTVVVQALHTQRKN